MSVGDKVLTDMGYRVVKDKMRYEDAPVYEVRTTRGLSIRGTGNHKLRVIRSWAFSKQDVAIFKENSYYYKFKNNRAPIWEWVNFRDLQTGDQVDTRCLEYFDGVDIDFSDIWPGCCSHDVAYLIGYALGDATLSRDGFSYSCGSLEEVEHLSAVIEKVTGKPCLVHKRHETYYQCYLSNRAFVRKLESVGFRVVSAQSKEIPLSFRKCTSAWLASLLAGYLDADGSVDRLMKSVRFTSVSKALLDGFGWIAKYRLGLRWVAGKNSYAGRLKRFPSGFYHTKEMFVAGISGDISILCTSNSVKAKLRVKPNQQVS